MTTSRTKGGGFLVGVLYGVIASTALFFVLSYLFPIKSSTETEIAGAEVPVAQAPVAMETAGAETTAPDIGAEPRAPAMAAPQMGQPDVGGNETTTIGGTRDTTPASAASTQIASNEAVSEPLVETVSAEVPNIGNETTAATAPGAETAAPSAPAQGAASAPAVAPSVLSASESGPAIEVFAAAFTGDTSKPLLAIVLEDTLEASLQPLVDSGIPFSFALPAGQDASASAQAIRESGFEVVAMIPRATSRADVTVETITRFMQNVPVAVALIDADTSAPMLSSTTMQVILEATGPSGLGLISYSRTGEQIARRQAGQAGVLFGSALQITDELQDEALIVQALNQAAFVASTNGRAIVFAKANEATINGILSWLASARANQLSLVPVSVALRPPVN